MHKIPIQTSEEKQQQQHISFSKQTSMQPDMDRMVARILDQVRHRKLVLIPQPEGDSPEGHLGMEDRIRKLVQLQLQGCKVRVVSGEKATVEKKHGGSHDYSFKVEKVLQSRSSMAAYMKMKRRLAELEAELMEDDWDKIQRSISMPRQMMKREFKRIYQELEQELVGPPKKKKKIMK